MTIRLGILLSGSGTTYENLECAIAEGRLPATVAVVIGSKPGLGGFARAERFGRPQVVASKAAEVTAALDAHQVDLVVMCGWLKFYDPPAHYAGKTVNIHPSLLPKHGGKGMYGHHVHAAVVAAGDTETGCTAHIVSGAYDSGRVLAQGRVPVLPTDSADDVQAKVQAVERALYPRVIADLIAAQF